MMHRRTFVLAAAAATAAACSGRATGTGSGTGGPPAPTQPQLDRSPAARWPDAIRRDDDPQWYERAAFPPIEGMRIGEDNYSPIMRHFDRHRAGVMPPGGPYFVDTTLRDLRTNAVLLASGGFTVSQLYRRRNIPILEIEETAKLTIRGVSFMDNPEQPAGDAPLVRLPRIYMSLLTDNFYIGSAGDGLVVGGGTGLETANDVIIERDYAWNNGGRGIVLESVAAVHLRNARSEYNSGGNLEVTTPDDPPFSQWGLVTLDGCRLEGYHRSPFNARIRGRRVIARDCHISGANVLILPGSIECDLSTQRNQYADAWLIDGGAEE
jgi:hypothetical protein